ncbi:DUF5518 domain-containing protein [Halobellus marinus]|uniref:DUF5518 domain-containing protein n=1 Tax=Halobellus TaxID=1073986 RepID=UPI0028A5CDA2|nr:DUF5518 domain-containing protein [Halobellus sp. DFY28]
MRWKCVLLGGGVALPCTAFSYWQTGSEVSLGAVVLGGLLTGYLLTQSNSDTSRAGIQVGILGGLPVLWAVFDTYVAAAGFTEPVWFKLAEGVLLFGFIITGFGIAALAGEVGVRIGTWLADSVTNRRSRVTR